MEQISLDNFRVFGTPAAFDLAPVTVLTGKNNSGKSSLIKAFLVLADYLEQDDQTVLRLDGPRASRHRISDWKNLANWDCPMDNLVLGYRQGEAHFTFEFEPSGKNQSPRLFRFRMDIPEIDRLTLESADGGKIYQLDVSQKFIDYVAGSPKEQKKLRETAEYAHQVVAARQELASLTSKLEASEQPTDFPLLLQQRQQLEARIQNLLALQAQGEKSAGLFFQAEVVLTKLTRRPSLGALIEGALEAYISNNVPLDDTYTVADIIAEYGLEEDEYGTVNPERLLKATQEWHQNREEELERRQLQLSAEQSERILRKFRAAIERSYFTVEHLSANRTHQSRLYPIGGAQHSEISAVAENFQRFGKFAEKGARQFLTRWLPKFNIGEEVDVQNIDNVAIRVIVTRGVQKVNLVDLGFGAGQVLTILLQIAALIQRQESGMEPGGSRYRPRFILIEEPEANLHPQFQSLLSELFSELAQSRYQFQFVLETHSEYLLRKLQVLVKEAGGNTTTRRNVIFEGNQVKQHEQSLLLFKVYYLDQPTRENDMRYGHEMRLRDDGMFMDEFGEGFLMNESANLTFKLF